MENENKVEEQGLSISDIFFIVKKNIIFIIIITMIFTLVGGFYAVKVKKPTYTAISTAMVVIKTDNGSQNPATSYVYASYYTSAFTDFIQTNSVLNDASDMLLSKGIEMNKTQISNCIKVSSQTDSLIITINATIADKDQISGSEKAVLIANTVLEAAIKEANSKKIENGKEVYKYEPFAESLIEMEQADIEDVIYNKGTFTIIVISMLLGLALSFGVILVKHLLDDTYTSKELFEKTYKINVLSVISEIVENNDGGVK